MAVCLLLGLLVAGSAPRPAAAALEIPGAIPAIGRLLDIRDVRQITAPKGKCVATVSHVAQVASKKFDAKGARVDLPFDQTITRQSVPVSLAYGLTRRLNVGAGAALANDVNRRLSVLNFVDGASILGIPLPAGQVSELHQSGDGPGDLQLFAQYEPGWFDRRPWLLLTAETVLPTARSDPRDPRELPQGQGHRSLRLSCSALREVFPLTWFAKASLELNGEADMKDTQGRGFRVTPGDGLTWAGGASFAIGRHVALQGLLVGSWRDAGATENVATAVPFSRSLDLRPGLGWNRGDFTFTHQLSLPVAGRNALSMTGSLFTVEYRF